MSSDDIKDWITLHSIPGIGSISFLRLVKFFGSPRAVLDAGLKDLLNVRGITPAISKSIVDYRDTIDAERELDLIKQYGCRIIKIDDEEYPANLRTIYDPPPIIYIKGSIIPNDSQSISIVGARKASAYGKSVAENISKGLVLKGFTIVSGMAHGIDASAHNAALDAGGRTIAVMGNGLDIIYPPNNEKLYERIINSGAVISEFPMGTEPKKENFPIRNRIISGLSLGTLVVEASNHSGALITANYALEQGREVFAVPGPIFSETSKGTNSLIKQGAKLVESTDDILTELTFYIPNSYGNECEYLKDDDKIMEKQLSEEEYKIWKVVDYTPIHIDDITRQTNLPTSVVSAMLVILELKGLIQQQTGKLFVKKISS
ncbi:MAG: DNA-processing protein DprA [bacterium]